MQRNISDKKTLKQIGYLFAFILYESLSSIYLFLPPLFSVLFFLYVSALKQHKNFTLFLIILALLFFEADKGYTAFSSILYFTLIAKFVMPKVVQNFGCSGCIRFSYVFFAYIGFYFVSLFLANIFMAQPPEFSYYIIYYIVVEFFFVSLL